MENTFAQRLNMLIDDRQITAAALARKLDRATSQVYSYLSGQSIPRIDVAQAILEVYPGLNGHWLLTGEGNMWLPEAREFLHPHDPGVRGAPQLEQELAATRKDLHACNQRVEDLVNSLKDKDELIRLYKGRLSE